MENMLLADLVGLSHALFVLFVVAGQGLVLIGWLRGWDWTRGRTFRFLHLGAIGFVVIESWFAIPCPLTVIEADLRGTVGDVSFIAYWLERLLYYQAPKWAFITVYSLFGGLTLLTFFCYPPKHRKKR